LAVPVLAGSGAYAIGEALGWTTGLDRQPLDAKAFYGTIAVSTLVGIGLLAVPVLAGSGAYALGEALGWTTGLDRQPLDAKAFYGTIAVSTLIGIFINFVGLDPIKALFWSAVINGMVAGPLIAAMTVVASLRSVMGTLVLPTWLRVLGWATALLMVAGTVGLVAV
ncbi:MAG TPA: divalent metal cation transporter, partial [Acetobacteraceae bacterium]|nr:divalent metal cation transporter [Acetobacteraceae bacterium]